MAPSAIDTTLAQEPIKTPKIIKPNSRFDFVTDNVWQWIHEVEAASPVQPICNLGTGFNEQSPPEFVRQKHAEALDSFEHNQYAPISGASTLKNAIAQVYSKSYGRRVDSSQIMIASGAQEALLSCVMAFLGPGDEAILLEPAFQMYEYQVAVSGAKITWVPIRPPKDSKGSRVSSSEWKIDLAELEDAITPRTKLLYFNNPQNPLGKVFTRQELLDIGNICVKHGLVILSDEVYERVVFGQDGAGHIPMTSLSPAIAANTLTAVSMGKLFNATGWRIGFVTGPSNLIDYVSASHLVLAYSSSTPAQEACANGLLRAEETDWWAVNRQDIAQRVNILSSILDEVGLSYVVASGAWFLWVNVDSIKVPVDYPWPDLIKNKYKTADWKACYFLVQQFGISSIPGTCFYSKEHSSMGASYIRLGACKNDEGLALARERLLQLKPYVT